MNASSDSPLVDLSKFFAEDSLSRQLFRSVAQKPIEHLLGLSKLNVIYANIKKRCIDDPSKNFFDHCLDELQVTHKIVSGSLEDIPENGPVFIVSNHPFGGTDGVLLGSLIKQRRKDSCILANSLLGHMPEIREHLIEVNPFGGDKATRQNRKGLLASHKWLAEEKCLATFPSGKVSYLQPSKGGIHDGPWHANVARLARKHNATVIPLFIEGSNSKLFQILGLIHPRLRTLLLVHELVNKVGAEIQVRVGSPILPHSFADHGDDAQLARYFQARSTILQHQEDTRPEKTQSRVLEDIIERPPVETLIADIESLPAENLLCQQGVFQVYTATSDQIPHLMQEIGRTREQTFRAVGEGSGKALDLDRFDEHYHQLILWNNETCEIVGGYRIGLIDEIIKEHGYKGLYSSSIFDYSPDAFDNLSEGKPLELGRSYIIPAYQRRGTSLFLLWRGIVKFMRLHPGYTKLFGAVSTSDDYHPLSQALIIRYLKRNKLDKDFEEKIRPRKRPSFESLRSLKAFDYPGALPSLDQVSGLISELEPDNKGVPTLLKHYLGLNGVMLGFGINQNFGNALEGYILVDTEKITPAVMQKYEGKTKITRKEM